MQSNVSRNDEKFIEVNPSMNKTGKIKKTFKIQMKVTEKTIKLPR
jgi:hypothetical protein